MATENTLLGRCTVAYVEAFEQAISSWPDSSARRRGTAAVLNHLSYELVELSQRRPGMDVHSLALLLRQEAQP
jgi:hypothetical protein